MYLRTMSVYENLLLGAYTRKDKAEIAESTCKMVYKRFPRLEERKGPAWPEHFPVVSSRCLPWDVH